MEKPDQSVQGTQALARALAVLSAVSRGHSDLAAIGREAETGKSTTHRLVLFLQRNGYLRHVDGRGYLLGSKLIELGGRALEQMPLTTVARPHLERLAERTGETVHLSVRDGDVIIYVDKISGKKGLEMRSHIGLRKPTATTGTGKAQMLDLPEAEWERLYNAARLEAERADAFPPGFPAWENFVAAMRKFKESGFTLEMEENEAGIRCVAAPIRGARSEIVAGLSVASTLPVMTEQRLQSIAPVVLECAAAIATDMGYASEAAKKQETAIRSASPHI